MAEKNKFCLRIERLTNNASKDRTKSSESEVEKSLSFIADQEREASDTNGKHLKLATADIIRDDARIKAVKAKAREYTSEYKRLQAEGKTNEALCYQTENRKCFTASEQLNNMSRTMNANKKLLGKRQDYNIMKIIDSNRRSMLKVLERVELLLSMHYILVTWLVAIREECSTSFL